MRVNVQRNFSACLGQIRERWNRDGHVITDARGLNNDLIGMLGQQLAAEMGDHCWPIVARAPRWTLMLMALRIGEFVGVLCGGPNSASTQCGWGRCWPC